MIYNVAATLISVPAGHVGDRCGPVRVLAAGAACFALAYTGFAATDASIPLPPPASRSPGIGIGRV